MKTNTETNTTRRLNLPAGFFTSQARDEHQQRLARIQTYLEERPAARLNGGVRVAR